MNYLFAACAVIWFLLFAYVFTIAKRQQKIQDELARIQELLDHPRNPGK
jgi:CcmD family protein